MLIKFYSAGSVSLFLILSVLEAQIPRLTAFHKPVQGTSIEIHQVIDSTHGEGSGGTQKFWDFSDAQIGPIQYLFEYQNPSITPGDGEFGDANLAIYNAFNRNYDYYESSDSLVSWHGYWDQNNRKFYYSDGAEVFRFPMEYGDQYSDHYEGVDHEFGNVIRMGQVNVSCDGEGVFKGNLGLLKSNVLRLRYAFTEHDSIQDNTGFWYSVYRSWVEYYWFGQDIQTPLAKVVVSSNGTREVFLFSQPPIQIEDEKSPTVLVYPNPLFSQIWVESSIPIHSFSIVKINGTILRKEELESNQERFTLNLSEFPDGIYLLKLIDANGMADIRRLVKLSGSQ